MILKFFRKSQLLFVSLLIFLLIFSSFELIEVAPGVRYQNIVTGDPQSIHVLEIDPNQVEIVPARALDEGIGRESVLSLANRHQAIAAINGGFFKIGTTFDGLPMGILKIDNQWYALPHKPRGAIGWTRDAKQVLFDQLLCSAQMTVQETQWIVQGVNTPRKPGEIILYFPTFHKTTLTGPDTAEIIVQKDKVQTVSDKVSNAIPEDGMVISLDKQAIQFWQEAVVQHPKVEITIKPISQSNPPYTNAGNWQKMDHIVGGSPILIRRGQIVSDFSLEQLRDSFLNHRHPRTAIGVRGNGSWIWVVVDGHHPLMSRGLTMYELAVLMHALGCVEALNLDGGGSSTMVINNKVVNSPMGDEDENEGVASIRRVSDAILIKSRKVASSQ